VFENRVVWKIMAPKKEEVTGEWKRLRNGSLWSVLRTKYYSGDQNNKNEMDEARGTYGGEVYTGFWWGDLMERDHLEDLSLQGKIMLRQISKPGMEGHELH